jgi:hypothetical protein
MSSVMMRMMITLAVAVAACGYQPPRAPAELHAYCGSTCWNNSYCTGQGIACEKCIGGVCSGSTLLAPDPGEAVSQLDPAR